MFKERPLDDRQTDGKVVRNGNIPIEEEKIIRTPSVADSESWKNTMTAKTARTQLMNTTLQYRN